MTPGAKKKGVTPVTVTWSGFLGGNVDFYKNGAKTVQVNPGVFTDSLKGSGTVVYKVCETASSTCAQASIVF